MIFHSVLLLVILGVETAIIVQGLPVDRHALGSRFSYSLDALFCAHMYEIDRRTSPFGHSEDSPEGNILGFIAMYEMHIPPFVSFFNR